MAEHEAKILTVSFLVKPGPDVEKIHAAGNWKTSSWTNAFEERDQLLALLGKLIFQNGDPQIGFKAYKDAIKLLEAHGMRPSGLESVT